MANKDVFDFNHIDPNISEEKLLELKQMYRFYHKKFWCFKKAFRYFKRLNLGVNLSSATLVAAGATAGGATLNPLVIRIISETGLKTAGEIKDYKKKSEMSKFAFSTYRKRFLSSFAPA